MKCHINLHIGELQLQVDHNALGTAAETKSGWKGASLTGNYK